MAGGTCSCSTSKPRLSGATADEGLLPPRPLIVTSRRAALAPVRGPAAGSATSKWLGLAAIVMASVNIFGGFAVTERMLAMYKKKERKG